MRSETLFTPSSASIQKNILPCYNNDLLETTCYCTMSQRRENFLVYVKWHPYHFLLVPKGTSSQQNPMKTSQGIQICLPIGPTSELFLCLQSLRASEDGPFGLSYTMQANSFLFFKDQKG